jgi:hypothetical protein
MCVKLPFKQELCGLPIVLSLGVSSFFYRQALQAGLSVCFVRNCAAFEAVKAACFWG